MDSFDPVPLPRRLGPIPSANFVPVAIRLIGPHEKIEVVTVLMFDAKMPLQYIQFDHEGLGRVYQPVVGSRTDFKLVGMTRLSSHRPCK